MEKDKEALARQLYETGCIKFGEFTLKSGMKSPFYVDLRVLVSHPKTLSFIGKLLAKKAKRVKFDRIAGIPYAGIPIATAMSLESKKPMVYTRKEKKDYGTKKDIEGEFKRGETALIVDDIITTGESKIEVILPLTEAGLLAKDVLVVVDREQGGAEFLAGKGLKLTSAITIKEIFGFLLKKKLVDKTLVEKALAFVDNNRV